MTITHPFEPYSNQEFWTEELKAHKYSVDQVKKDPTLLLRQTDVMKTRTFSNIFGEFIPDSVCDLRLINVDYKFKNALAKTADKKFKKSLKALDEKLKTTPSTMETPKYPDETKAEGLRLIPLNDLVATVCY